MYRMGRIFISYHGSDGASIATYLRSGLIIEGYKDCYAYTAPGLGPQIASTWRESLRRDLLAAEALIVITTPGSSTDWCVWEISVFRERKPGALCLEFFSGLAQGRAILDDRQAQRIDPDDPLSLALARDTATRLLARFGVGKNPMLTSPFPGLKAFDEDQASLFFGREDDTTRLTASLTGARTNGAMAVIGPSGAGKSSLVRAGLLPALKRRGEWKIVGPVTPAHGAIEAIASALGVPEERIKENVDSLAELLVKVAPNQNRLIVLDQAEELLIGAADGILAGDSALLVRALVEASSTVAWLVYTVRADFLDALMRHEQFTPLLRDDFLVNPLTKADLPLVVNGPLATLGWRLDDAALGLIQEDSSGESLPLLAFALENLWRFVNPDLNQNPRAITRSDYVEAGRVMDLLRRQADEAFAMARDLMRDGAGRWQDPRQAERYVLRTLRRLVAVDEAGKFTKRPVALRELTAEERLVLEPFVANRVLTTTRLLGAPMDGWGRHGQDGLEVAHESLFVHWPRLQESLERDHVSLKARREVEDIATNWLRNGSHSDQLIASSRLVSMLAALSPTFTDESFTEFWPQLNDTLSDLHFSKDARRLLHLSLQARTDDEVQRAVMTLAIDPSNALSLLAGNDLAARSMLHAPNLEGWRRTLLRAMASGYLLRSFTGHEGGIWGVDWSPDDTALVTGSKDGTVRVWDGETGECRIVFSHGRERRGNDRGWVRAVAWSPRGDLIASAATDETLRLWSVSTNEEVRVLQLPDRPWSVRFDAEGLRVVVSCANGSAYLWEVESLSREPLAEFRCLDTEGLPVKVWDADISPDGEQIAAARDDGRIDVWQVSGIRKVEILPHQDLINTLTAVDEYERSLPAVRSVRFHPHSPGILASGDQGWSVRLHKSGLSLALNGHTDQVRQVSWSRSGIRLATASADAVVRVWDAVTGREVLSLRGHGQGVCDIAWSHSGDRLATVADDGSQRVWKIGSEPNYDWVNAVESVRAIAWNPQTGDYTVGTSTNRRTGSSGEQWSHWLPEENRHEAQIGLTFKFVGSSSLLQSVAWSSDGQRLAIGYQDGTVTLLDQHHQVIAELTDATDGVHDAQWSADGALLAVVSRDRSWLPRIYDRDGMLIQPSSGIPRWTRHSGFLRAVAWHPHDAVFAVAGEDNLITVNSLTRTLGTFEASKRFACMAWHPNGELLAVGCTDSTVLVLRIDEEITTESELLGHADEINVIAWSTDGTLLLTASDDATARVWNPVTGAQLTALIGHGGSVTAALWSPDGRVITGSVDRTIRFWDISDGSDHPLSGSPNGTDVADLIVEARLRTR